MTLALLVTRQDLEHASLATIMAYFDKGHMDQAGARTIQEYLSFPPFEYCLTDIRPATEKPNHPDH
jgi:hypothetical protein